MTDGRYNLILCCLFPSGRERPRSIHPTLDIPYVDRDSEEFFDWLQEYAANNQAHLKGSCCRQLETGTEADYLLTQANDELFHKLRGSEYVVPRIPHNEIFDAGLELYYVRRQTITVLRGEVVWHWYGPLHGTEVMDFDKDFANRLTRWADSRLQPHHRVGVRDCMIRGSFVAQATDVPSATLTFEFLKQLLADCIFGTASTCRESSLRRPDRGQPSGDGTGKEQSGGPD